MRIGFLIYGSLDRLTGGYLYDHRLVEHLRRHGHEVEVVALPLRGYARSLLDNLSRPLLARLLGSGFDLLLEDELTHPSCVWLNRRLRRQTTAPIVAIVHLLRSSQPWAAWRRPLYRAIERRYLTSVDGLIFVSPRLQERVARLVGAPPPSIVAPPAGDHAAGAALPDEIRARAHQPGPLRVLFLGNLSPMKSLHLVLDALARLPTGGFHLEVIGSLEADPAYVRSIRRRIAAAGLERQVTLRGELPPHEVAAHLSRGHLLALPSAPESHGIAYDEAMSHGLPVIASTESDGAARFAHGRDAFLVAPNDAPALAAHLRLLHENREELARMGIEAQRSYAGYPTWADSMERAHRFLAQLAADRHQTTYPTRST